MTTKAEFNAEEWDRVLQGPAIAGLMVVSAQRGGTIRESMEMAKAYKEARQEHARTDLLGEIVSTPPTRRVSRPTVRPATPRTSPARLPTTWAPTAAACC